MRSRIHPVSRQVAFRDRAANTLFLIRSTAASDRTIEWEDGSTYPLIDVDVSSASHPFYTGTSRVVDTAGRVERFERRYGRTATATATATALAPATAPAPATASARS